MLFVSQIDKQRRREMTAEENTLFGIEKLNVTRSDIPAVTHVDHSARIQTVHRETNPRYHALISAFKARTGCPVLVNTSFNVRGEPIVCTPRTPFNASWAPRLNALSSVTAVAKGGPVSEPFSAGGDVDLDGVTNLDEYNNAVGSDGDYVQVASDPFLDGTEGPNPIPVAGLVGIGMLLAGMGALGAAAVRRRN